MNRSFLILFIPFLLFYPLLIEICAGLPTHVEAPPKMDVRLVTLGSDFNALAVPSPQKLRSLGLASALDCGRRTRFTAAARTGVEPVHQP